MLAGFRLLPWLYDRMVGPLARVGAFTREAVLPTVGNVFTSTADEDEDAEGGAARRRRPPGRPPGEAQASSGASRVDAIGWSAARCVHGLRAALALAVGL